jgi:hypothetical protein
MTTKLLPETIALTLKAIALSLREMQLNGC